VTHHSSSPSSYPSYSIVRLKYKKNNNDIYKMRDIDTHNFPISILSVSFNGDDWTYDEARIYLHNNLSRNYIEYQNNDTFHTFIINRPLMLENETRILYNDDATILLEYELSHL
jgi:hypothetical protein